MSVDTLPIQYLDRATRYAPKMWIELCTMCIYKFKYAIWALKCGFIQISFGVFGFVIHIWFCKKIDARFITWKKRREAKDSQSRFVIEKIFNNIYELILIIIKYSSFFMAMVSVKIKLES